MLSIQLTLYNGLVFKNGTYLDLNHDLKEALNNAYKYAFNLRIKDQNLQIHSEVNQIHLILLKYTKTGKESVVFRYSYCDNELVLATNTYEIRIQNGNNSSDT